MGATPLREGDHDWVDLTVDDEGEGVPHRLRNRLFEPFYSSRSDSGGGLGLAICKRLVEEVGGQIHIEDGPSGGARFRVRLPCAEQG